MPLTSREMVKYFEKNGFQKVGQNSSHIKNSKSVKKTLTIPGWLDEEATAMGINFSQTLQEALIGKLQPHT